MINATQNGTIKDRSGVPFQAPLAFNPDPEYETSSEEAAFMAEFSEYDENSMPARFIRMESMLTGLGEKAKKNATVLHDLELKVTAIGKLDLKTILLVIGAVFTFGAPALYIINAEAEKIITPIKAERIFPLEVQVADILRRLDHLEGWQNRHRSKKGHSGMEQFVEGINERLKSLEEQSKNAR